MAHHLVGRGVFVRSLQQRPDLNGRRGKVLSFDESSGRATVEIGAGSAEQQQQPLRYALRPANLFAAAVMSPGDIAMKFPSSSAAAVEPLPHWSYWPVYTSLQRPRIFESSKAKRFDHSPESTLPLEFLAGFDDDSVRVITAGREGGEDDVPTDHTILVWLRRDPSQRIMFIFNYTGQSHVEYSGSILEGIGADARRELMLRLIHEVHRRVIQRRLAVVLLCQVPPEILYQVMSMPSLSSPRSARSMELSVPIDIHVIDENVAEIYSRKQRWAEFLDMSMSMLDKAIADCDLDLLDVHDTLAWRVMLALTSFGDPAGAAAVCEESAGHLLASRDRCADSAFVMSATLWWRQAKQWERAEVSHSKALQALSREGDLSALKESALSTLEDIAKFYYYRAREGEKKTGGCDETKIFASLRVLLSMAGHRFKADFLPHNDIPIPVRSMKTAIRREYQKMSKARAWAALAGVIRKATSVETMRAALLSFVHPKAKLRINVDRADVSLGAKDAKDFAKRTRKFVRERAKSSAEWTLSCDGCQKIKPEAELMLCPCMMVMYCNSECQSSHWKVHKETCSLKKN